MADIKTKQVSGNETPWPVIDYFLGDANTLIEGNRLVWARRDTGFAQNSTYAVANPLNVVCLGVCQEHFDNTTGNAFSNSGLTGARGRYNRGVFLCNNDGTLSQSSLGAPVFLVSDVTPTNNSLVTVSASSAGGSRPYVGFVTTNPRGSTEVPDGGKIPVAIGIFSNGANVPGTLTQDYINDPTIHTAAFTVVPGVMHKFNFQATGNINFPVITAAMDGYHLSLVNLGTGATAVTLVGGGTNNVGIVANGVTGATAASPASAKAQVYCADFTQGSWVPGI